jgi:hypothetical protein
MRSGLTVAITRYLISSLKVERRAGVVKFIVFGRRVLKCPTRNLAFAHSIMIKERHEFAVP